MPKDFSVRECLAVGWGRFKQESGFMVAMLLATYALMILFEYIIEDVYRGIEPSRSLFDFLSNGVLYWLYFGMTLISLKIVDGKPYVWRDLFVFDRQVLRYLAGSLLYGLMVVLGLLLFVVPGVYLALRYGFSAYAIVDGRKGIGEAFRESARITTGVKWNLLLYGLAALGLILLGILCFGVGLLVAVPVIMLATAHLYRVLLQATASPALVAPILPEAPALPPVSVVSPVVPSPTANETPSSGASTATGS